MGPPGHSGPGLAAKRVAPGAPLWALLVASELPDLLCFPFIAAGTPLVGLGLWGSGPGYIASIMLEVVLLSGGIAIYILARRRAIHKISLAS